MRAVQCDLGFGQLGRGVSCAVQCALGLCSLLWAVDSKGEMVTVQYALGCDHLRKVLGCAFCSVCGQLGRDVGN